MPRGLERSLYSLSRRDGFVLPGGCAASPVSSTAWRLSCCPAGSLLPSGCAASRRLLSRRRRDRCAPRLPRPRPSSASQARAPRCPHETASPKPRPGPRAGSPRSRETWPLAPAWRNEFPLPQIGELILGAGVPARRDGSCSYVANGGVVVKSAPRATGAMAPERAGPERADRCVETWAAEGRTTRVRAASGTTRSHAKAGRRAALEAQPERPLKARGAKETPRSGKTHRGRAPTGQERSFTQ